MDIRYNDKNMKEKLGSSVTELLSDNLAYLPLKKRRPLLRSPSPPPPTQTPLDGICAPPHDPVSDPKPEASNNLVEVERSQGGGLLASSACKNNNQEKLLPLKTITDASNNLVEVQKNPSIENSLVKNNLTRIKDSYASQLLAPEACKRNNFDVHNAKVGDKQEISVKKEQLSTPQETDACMDISSLKTSIDNAQVKNKADDIRNAEVAVKREKFLTPQGMDVCMDMPSSRKSSVKTIPPRAKDSFAFELVASDASKINNLGDVRNDDRMDFPSLENSTLKVSTSGAQSDITDQIDSTPGSLNLLDKTDDDVEKVYGSGKYVRLHWDLNSMMDDWELPVDDQSIASKGNGVENISSVVSEKLNSSIGSDDSVSALRLFNCKSDISQLKHLDSGSSSDQSINRSTKLSLVAQENICTPKIQLGEALSVKNVKLEKQDYVFLDAGSVSDKNMHDMVHVKSKQEPIKLHEASSTMTDASNSSSKSEKAALPNVYKIVITPPVTTLAVTDCIKKESDLYSPTNVSPLEKSLSGLAMKSLSGLAMKKPMPKSDVQFDPLMGNPSSDVVMKELISKSPKVVTVVNRSLDVETKQLMRKSREHSGDVALEDPLDDGDVSDLSLGGHNHSISLVKENKYTTGYESSFEDCEVRVMDMNSSEENECERECLDYDIEDRDAYDYDMEAAGSQSIQNDDNIDFIKKTTLESVVNSLNESSTSASVENLSGRDQIAIAGESIHETVISDSCRLDTSGSFTKEMQSRAMRANLSSRVGELPASGTIDEKDTVFIQQHRSGLRFQGGQMFRGDKYLRKDRHFPQMQDERRKNNWNGSSSSFLGSRNNFQNKHQRGGSHTHPQLRNAIPVPKTDNCIEQRQSTNYRPFVRKRPLDNSDKEFSPQRRNVESRDDGHGIVRGRSGNYQWGGFRGPISNVPAPSSPYMPARRKRSSSPILNRNPSFSRVCRRSRSRSRSRIERTRIQQDPNNYGANDDIFCSPPRKRFSQGNSGSFQERNSRPSCFRNSPGRFLGQQQRVDSGGSLERVKSDAGFRPRILPQRFSKPCGEVWRGHNRENNNNERLKFGDRNIMIHRGRQDGNGAIRRFHSDEAACFDGRNNRNNKCWEGRGPFKYDRERN